MHLVYPTPTILHIMRNDFDFLIGEWKVFNTRLEQWLSNCQHWLEFESRHIEKHLHWGGTVALHHYLLDNIPFERSVLRTYSQFLDFWKIDRLDTITKLTMAPLTGTFWSNKGSFIANGRFENKSVLVSVEWTKICTTYACWEQALSTDNGKTWETNWIMEFYKKIK